MGEQIVHHRNEVYIGQTAKNHGGLTTLNPIQKICLLMVGAALIFGLYGCDELVSILSESEPPSPYPDELLIGVVMPQSGVYVDGPDDPNIVRYINGFYMARDEINNAQLAPPRIRFILEDNRSTPEGAIAAYNKLIHEDGVVALLGPAASTLTEAAFPVAENNRIVAIAPSSAAQGLSALGDFVFRVNLSVEKRIPPGLRLTQATLGYQRVAILADSIDVFSLSAAGVYSEILAELNVKILTTETFPSHTEDLRPQLTRIRDFEPDAVLVAANTFDQPTVLIQGREVGIPDDVSFIVPALGLGQVQEAGAAAEGAITFAAWTSMAERPASQAFVQNYAARYGEHPTLYTALAYTSVQLLVNAISEAGSTDSDAIREALAATIDFETVLGGFSYDAVGDAQYDPVVLVVRDGELQPF
jgi:branched-chain amino acid transport system substrate-binding protein